MLWWRRRPDGVLGAPMPPREGKGAGAVLAIVALLGLLLPLFGATLVAVLLLERLVLRRATRASRWLGLRPRTA